MKTPISDSDCQIIIFRIGDLNGTNFTFEDALEQPEMPRSVLKSPPCLEQPETQRHLHLVCPENVHDNKSRFGCPFLCRWAAEPDDPLLIERTRPSL